MISHSNQGKKQDELVIFSSNGASGNFLVKTNVSQEVIQSWLKIVSKKQTQLSDFFSASAQEEFSLVDKMKNGQLHDPGILSFATRGS